MMIVCVVVAFLNCKMILQVKHGPTHSAFHISKIFFLVKWSELHIMNSSQLCFGSELNVAL